MQNRIAGNTLSVPKAQCWIFEKVSAGSARKRAVVSKVKRLPRQKPSFYKRIFKTPLLESQGLVMKKEKGNNPVEDKIKKKKMNIFKHNNSNQKDFTKLFNW